MAEPKFKTKKQCNGRYDKEVIFDCVTDLVEFANSEKPKYCNRQSSRDNGFDFTGTQSYEEAQDLAERGWRKGMEQVREAVKQIDKMLGIVLPEQDVESNVVGHAVNVGAYLAGRPDAMVKFTETDQNKKNIRILVNIGALWFADKEAMARRGAAVMALIQVLEKQGHATTVDMCSPVKAGGGNSEYKMVVKVPLKRPGFNIETDRLAFWSMHASALRRFIFAVRERMDKTFVRKFVNSGGYGSSYNAHPDDLLKYDVYLPAFDDTQSHNWSTPEKAMQWVLDCLEAQGIEFKTKREPIKTANVFND